MTHGCLLAPAAISSDGKNDTRVDMQIIIIIIIIIIMLQDTEEDEERRLCYIHYRALTELLREMDRRWTDRHTDSTWSRRGGS